MLVKIFSFKEISHFPQSFFFFLNQSEHWYVAHIYSLWKKKNKILEKHSTKANWADSKLKIYNDISLKKSTTSHKSEISKADISSFSQYNFLS